MFNPHIHQQQQQQQQQQFHQHLRQLQQLFQQQPPPPPPPQPPPGHHVAHHHQTQRAIAVPPQTAPPARMVNLCQATQTTIIAPNPMLQGAIMMQQMQGNMRSFGMGGQQFRQFFGARSSLLGPVPMGMAIKSPMMGFPAARPFHPHARYYNNTPITTSAPTTAATSASSSATSDSAARLPDRKRDSDQMEAGSSSDQPAAESSSSDASDKAPAGGVDGAVQIPEEQQDEPVVKKQRTEGPEKSKDACVAETVSVPVGVFSEDFNSNTEYSQAEDCMLLEGGFTGGADNVETTEETRADEVRSSSAPSLSGRLSEDGQQARLAAEGTLDKDTLAASPDNQEEEEEGAGEGANKFYCYLCSITCHNQHNFRSHMNSISHQQRMMEIQHMSNACLVTLLPRVQESLQGANREGEKKSDSKRWCSTCHSHFSGGVADHRRTMEHKLASRTDISSCAICKKHFKTSQAFLEHLQSHEHRQKLQEKGCEALSKLAALDTEGFSLEEEEEGSEAEEEAEGRQSDEGGQRDGQDGWSSFKEVTLSDMTSDERYDPDTVYGSSFLVPVAGFICGLCNKFYHFEASALHTHCKSLKHFENLKRYRGETRRKGEAVAPPADPLSAADSLRPSSVCPEDFLADDTSATPNPLQPTVTLTRLKQVAPEPSSRDSASATGADRAAQDLSLAQEEAEGPSQASAAPHSPAEAPAGSSPEPDSEPAAAVAAADEANNEEEEEEEETEAPAAQGRRNSTGRAKTASKRRSGRTGSRR